MTTPVLAGAVAGRSRGGIRGLGMEGPAIGGHVLNAADPASSRVLSQSMAPRVMDSFFTSTQTAYDGVE